MIYLDSCALVKLVVSETETKPLMRFLGHRVEEKHITSALARVEVPRAVRHHGKEVITGARRLLEQLGQLAITPELLDWAADIDHAVLRSLDAIHLASAKQLGEALTAFVTYDKRLANAADEAGLPVIAPT